MDKDKRRELYIDFDEYIRQGEPEQQEKAGYWQTAIGLQAVDGLKTSDYLKETARKHIEGEIDIDQARELIKSYYQSKYLPILPKYYRRRHSTSAPMDLCLCIVAFSKVCLSMQVRFVSMILLKRNGCWKVIR